MSNNLNKNKSKSNKANLNSNKPNKPKISPNSLKTKSPKRKDDLIIKSLSNVYKLIYFLIFLTLLFYLYSFHSKF